MLADLTGTPEDELLARIENVHCDNCGLVYKKEWFPSELLTCLFTERVPSHPKGWDVLSGRFTPKNFQHEVAEYERALRAQDNGQINRYRRALASIIDSIPALAGTAESRYLLAAIEAGDTAMLRKADPTLRASMREPTPYKRFSGFSAQGLWQYMENALDGIRSYGEVGCPLWGLLPRAAEQGREAIYFRRAEPNYWAEGCRTNGIHCTKHLLNQTNVKARDWSEPLEEKVDVLGAFQYLDHLENPDQFMTELFQKANTAAIILDAIDQPVYIQHLTGWTRDAIQWLANKHGCRVHDDFEDIRPSGNQLFLLEKR